MQTLSGLQRNIADQKTLTTYLTLLGLVLLYPSMASLYPILPPLLGLAYVKWRDALRQGDGFWVVAWMLYAVVFESVWSLPLYGIWALFFVTRYLVEPKVEYLLHDRRLIDIVAAVLFDLLYLAFLAVYGSIMHVQTFDFDLVMLYYLLVDVAAVVLF